MSVDHDIQSEDTDAVFFDEDAVVVDIDDQGNQLCRPNSQTHIAF